MKNIYISPTGNLIKEYLDEYKISQKELAKRTGMTEKHISNVLNDKSVLTVEFALKLEKVLTGIEASYWINYESKYREYLAREKEKGDLNNINLKATANRFRFKEVFEGLGLSLVEQAIEMLKLLKISKFSQFEAAYANINADFMEDGGEKEAIAIWMNLCETEIEIQNKELGEKTYNKSELKKNFDKFKLLSTNHETELSLNSCRRLCNKLGIYLVICEAITNSKVRGALTTYKGLPTIYLSGRFKSHSHRWFAFMHEIAHLFLHYDSKEPIISMEEETKESKPKEKEANDFARSLLVNLDDYAEFTSKKVFTKQSITGFAKKQNILPCIIVGFLQHDELIGYEQFNYI